MIILVLHHLWKVTLFTVIQCKRKTFSTVNLSVFTDDTITSPQDFGPSQYLSNEDITDTCEGVVKLLKKLKPHKTAGPDDIPLMLLKKAADEIAPAITPLFQASLDHGTLLRHGVRHLSYQFLRKVLNQMQATID